ncbi:MAG: VWA domain-containing protein [Methanothrix sp.]|uniref:vWA domain-containing protein n=1 Tax=Methanothrix sp. TaxID=90426 RepID=UPI0025FE4252|nr:VWA domain-containing protein [Methanothrix sp.]MCQ8902858.1 VWA domain-containing protein [Methanothrix sp.]
MPFRNPYALLGLLSILPLIVLYLIKPKPRDVLFPSIRFLEAGKARRSAALSRMIKDPLFWLQLLILIILSIAAAGPYTLERGSPGSHLVLVMDVSASMESTFQNALSIASSELSGYDRVSIVLAESIPVVALREGSADEARSILDKIDVLDLPADISSAMNLAYTLTGPEGGDILVISDFISWIGDDPGATRDSLTATGASIVFADTGGGGDNVGIVGGWLTETYEGINYTCRIHNYGSARSLTIRVQSQGGSSEHSAFIGADEDYYLSVSLPSGISTVSLDVRDAVSADNTAYIYAPLRDDTRILYLGDSSPALAALRAIGSVDTMGNPDGYDLVVIRNSSIDGGINRYVDSGGKIVYIPQENSPSPEYLPVRITGAVNRTGIPWARNPVFGEGIHFEEIGIRSYIDAVPRRGSTIMVELNSVPLLAYWNLGRGTVVYNALEYGSDFHLRPEYPVFWYEMVRWLTGAPSLDDVNRKTGEVVPLERQATVSTPGGTVTAQLLLLDRVGLYTFDGRRLAANLYDPAESDLRGGRSFAPGSFRSSASTEKLVERDLSAWLILAALLLLMAELGIIRWRREL